MRVPIIMPKEVMRKRKKSYKQSLGDVEVLLVADEIVAYHSTPSPHEPKSYGIIPEFIVLDSHIENEPHLYCQ
jgi:hypothetical protein